MPAADFPLLVERDAEVTTIAAAIEQAASGRGTTLVFQGPAGIGKSAMLDAASDLARARGFRVLAARADELGRTMPLGIVRQLLAAALRSLEPEEVELLEDSPARTVLRSLTGEDVASPSDAGGASIGLWWFVDWLADRDRSPIAIVVDDLHWGDDLSMAALAYLAARIDSVPAMLVCARRDGMLQPDSADLARLCSAAATTVRTLQPFTAAGTARVAAALDVSLDERVADRLHDATGGNPFLTTEMLRSESVLDRAVPPRVTEHLRVRMGEMAPSSIRTGVAIAVLGPWATTARVAEVVGSSLDETRDAIATLVAADLVEFDSTRCAFRHALLRDALLDTVDGARLRPELARRAADAAIADGLAPTIVASLLLHVPPSSDPSTARHLVDGASTALGSGSARDAIAFAERAIAEPIQDADLRARAWELVSEANTRLGDRAAALEAAVNALQLTREPDRRSELRIGIANLRIGLQDLAGAMQEFSEAANELERDTGSAARVAMLRAGGASFGRFLGAASDDGEPLLDSLPKDPSVDSPETRILLANVAIAYVLGNVDAHRARALARRALADGALLTEVTSDAPTYYVATAALAWTDDYSAALPTFDDAVADARRRGSPIAYAMATGSRGGMLMRHGELRRAALDLDASIEGRHDGWVSYLPMTGFMAARTYFELGEDDALRAVIQTCIDDRDPVRWGPLEPYVHAIRGLGSLADDEHDRALACFLDAVRAAGRQRQHAITLAEWRHLAVETAAATGQTGKVEDVSAQSVALARRLDAPRPLGLALRASALVTRDHDERLALLDEAIEAFEAASVQAELARSLMFRGVERSDRGDLDRALSIASRIGAARIVDELAGHGVIGGVPRIQQVLTPGEIRVAELAAAGRSNREIAQALFITVKAVEWHLSNCYRKLEIRGRRELADALAAMAVTPSGRQLVT